MGDIKHYDAYLEMKLVQMAEQFTYRFCERQYSRAFRIYENTRDIAVFMEAPPELMVKLFGDRQDSDESKHVVGIIPEELVNEAIEQCRIRNNTEMAERKERKRKWDEDYRRGKYTRRKIK